MKFKLTLITILIITILTMSCVMTIYFKNPYYLLLNFISCLGAMMLDEIERNDRKE